MHAKPLPEIQPSDLDAVRQFLTSARDEDRDPRNPPPASSRGPRPKLAPVLRNGIARARSRPASSPGGA